MFKRFEINKFAGLDCNTSPDLLSDEVGFARDIMNFRMEKIGKMVSRDGYIIGMTAQEEEDGSVNISRSFYIKNGGIIGIGEFVLSEYDSTIDTDRLMVYYIRGWRIDDKNCPAYNSTLDDLEFPQIPNYSENTPEHINAFLFVPTTGSLKGTLLSSTNRFGAYNDYLCDLYPQRDYEQTRLLRSPVKELSNRGTTAPSIGNLCFDTILDSEADFPTSLQEDEYISYYADLNQYLNKLIISDRKNCDMILEDLWDTEDRKNLSEGDVNRRHQLRIRPNTLQEFDINTVFLDARFKENQENSVTQGVETGMALYKWELPEKQMEMSEDNTDGSLTAGLKSQNDINTAYDRCKNKLSDPAYNTLLTSVIAYKGDNPVIRENNLISDLTYRFTNAPSEQKYNDLLDKLELHEDKYYDEEKDVTVKELAADVYIWEDNQIQYYPTGGHNNFLRIKDRFYDKTNATAQRVTKLAVQDGLGREAPIGSWRYKFVWDFGNGVYSAPSTEMLCPDILWSSIKDNDLDLIGVQSLRDLYTKPIDYNLISSNHVDDVYKNYMQELDNLIFESIDPPILSSFGKKYFDLKSVLYKDIDRKYGLNNATGYDNNGNVQYKSGFTWDKVECGNFASIVTLKSPENVITLNGIFFECIYCDGPGLGKDIEDHFSSIMHGRNYNDDVYDSVFASKKLILPTFSKQPSRTTDNHDWAMSCNGIFDRFGRLRLGRKFNLNWDKADYTTRPLAIMFPLFTAIFTSPIIELEFKHLCTTSSNKLRGNAKLPYSLFPNWMPDFGCNTHWDGNFYINIFGHNDDTLIPANNEAEWHGSDINSLATYNGINYDDKRPNTSITAYYNDSDSPKIMDSEVDSEAINRLLLEGYAKLDIINNGETYLVHPLMNGWAENYDSESTSDKLRLSDIYGDNTLLYTNSNSFRDYNYYYGSADEFFPNNLDLHVYLPGQRFVGIEQLCAMFPSSLLHRAPRMAIKIPSTFVPKRAKRLLVFRTYSSISNEYAPNTYGLVKTIDIERLTKGDLNLEQTAIVDGGWIDSDYDATNQTTPPYKISTGLTPGRCITRKYIDSSGTGGEANNMYDGIYFFDDVRDTVIDFSNTPDSYEGMRHALKSRFNITLYERTYYGNCIQNYQPEKPRDYEWAALNKTGISFNNTGLLRNTWFITRKADTNKGIKFNNGNRVQYCSYVFVYEDALGIKSQPIQTPMIDTTANSIDGDSAGEARELAFYFSTNPYIGSVKYLNIYRADFTAIDGTSTPQYRLIDKIEIDPDNEGVFVDDGLSGGQTLESVISGEDIDVINRYQFIGCKPNIQKYESGIFWSEPYRPDWIKMENLMEAGSGDGEQITGLEVQSGNLLIFKDNSIYRGALQALETPISRVDKVEAGIGCIAPNSLINIDDMIYFAAHNGFYMWNNNIAQHVDDKFNEELEFVMASIGEYRKEISCGYNKYFNEIYINVPRIPAKLTAKQVLAILKPDTVFTGAIDTGLFSKCYPDMQLEDYYDTPRIDDVILNPEYKEHLVRKHYGHIYVYNPSIKYSTKFSYPSTTLYKNNEIFDQYVWHPLHNVRKYFTNSLGELHSGDIIPKWYGVPINGFKTETTEDNTDYLTSLFWAGLYRETPFRFNRPKQYGGNIYFGNDPLPQGGSCPLDTFSEYDITLDVPETISLLLNGTSYTTYPFKTGFPRIEAIPIELTYRSKYFTMSEETVIKRLRNILINIFSKGKIKVKVGVIHPECLDTGIIYEPNMLTPASQMPFLPIVLDYNFNPSVDLINHLDATTTLGTQQSILTIVPDVAFLESGVSNDNVGKPIKFCIDYYGNRRTLINALVFNIRNIWSYLR